MAGLSAITERTRECVALMAQTPGFYRQAAARLNCLPRIQLSPAVDQKL